MRDWHEYAALIFLVLLLVACVVFVVYVVRGAIREREVTRECLRHGYSEARVYPDGEAFCVKTVDGSTVVVPIKDLGSE